MTSPPVEKSHLAVLLLQDMDGLYDGDNDGNSKLILQVWNIETSRPLYSIDIEKTLSHPWHPNFQHTLLLQDKLVRVATSTSIFVFDATTIEDRVAVLKSRREFHLDGAYDVILFNKFLAVSKLYDTITFCNFWK